jgi:hypothetical protein
MAKTYAMNAQLHAGRLDQELAEGADPGTSAILRQRARQLTSRRERERLASTLQTRLDEARAPNVSFSSAIPTQKREILRATQQLLELIDRLRQPQPIEVRGAARIRRLLIDGASPLYANSPEGALAQTLRTAGKALNDGA